MLGVEETYVIEPLLIHPSCEAELSFVSSDENVAVVAADGTVTGVGAGTAEITVTAVYGDVTVSDICRVVIFGEGDGLLAFENKTNTWSTISRMDATNVTSVSEAQPGVVAAAYVGDTIYGYDAQHVFFKVEGDAYTRTDLGAAGLEPGPMGEIGADFMDIRGMAYDAANDRLLVLAAKCALQDGWIDEYLGGAAIYEVNMETGALTALVTLDENLYGVRGMTVGGDGSVYVYTAFDAYFYVIDMETGSYEHKCTLQSLGIYGSSEHNMPMAYDAVTGLIYCLFTSNGSFHEMLTFDPATAKVQSLGQVGMVEYDPMEWVYNGPTFSALLIKN